MTHADTLTTMTQANSTQQLSKDTIREHYNKLGKKQNRQLLYEKPAFDVIFQYGEFDTANHIAEIGCGTGYFAFRLFKDYASDTAKYTGFDISETMIELTRKKLKPFAPRVTLIEGDATQNLSLENESIDRLVAAYVFDILSEDEMGNILEEAYRVLKPGSILCLASLTEMNTGLSGVVSKLWSKIYRFNPKWVGGCKAVDLVTLLDETKWKLQLKETLSAYGIGSEVVIVTRL